MSVANFIPPPDVRAAGAAAERAWHQARAAADRAAQVLRARTLVPARPSEVPQPRASSLPWGTPRHCVAPRGRPFSQMAPRQPLRDPRQPRAATRTVDVVQTVAAAAAQHADPGVLDDGESLWARVPRDGGGWTYVPVTVDLLQAAQAAAPPGGEVSVWATPGGGPVADARVLAADVDTGADYVSREQMWRDRHAAAEAAEESLRAAFAARRAALAQAESSRAEDLARRRALYAEHAWFRWALWAYRAARARRDGWVYHADGRLAPPDSPTPRAAPVSRVAAALVGHYVPAHGGARSVVRP